MTRGRERALSRTGREITWSGEGEEGEAGNIERRERKGEIKGRGESAMIDSKWEGEIGVRDDSGREREIWGRTNR